MKFNIIRILLTLLGIMLVVYIGIITLKTPKKRGFKLSNNVELFINGKKINTEVLIINRDFDRVDIIDEDSRKKISIASYSNINKNKLSEFEVWAMANDIARNNRLAGKIIDDEDDFYLFALYILGGLLVLYFMVYFSNDYIFIRDLIKNNSQIPFTFKSKKDRIDLLNEKMYCQLCKNKPILILDNEEYKEGMQLVNLRCSECGNQTKERVDNLK